MRLRVPRLEITAAEAKKLMRKDGGPNKLKTDGEKRAHIWMDNSDSRYALSELAIDRDLTWRSREETDDWAATSARGWRTKKGDIFSRVELIHVGRETIEKAHAETRRLESIELSRRWGGKYGIRIYAFGVPKPEPSHGSHGEPAPTVEQLEALDSKERFRLLFRGKERYGYANEVEEFEIYGSKGYIESEHHTIAIIPRSSISSFQEGAKKEYDEIDFSDLKETQSDDGKTYTNGESKEFCFDAEKVRKALRIYYPRFSPAKAAKEIRVLYPKTEAPICLLKEDDDWYPKTEAPICLLKEDDDWAILVSPRISY